MKFLLLLCLSLPIAGMAASSVHSSGDTLFYTYINNGAPVGTEWVLKKGGNDYYYHEDYNDRGRGPSINTHVRTDEHGNIVLSEITGVDYYKTAVNEHFWVTKGMAHWKNKFENDSVAYHNEVYSEVNGPSAENELILKKLKASPTGEIKVLPAGVWSYKKVSSKDSGNMHLELIAFSGSGFAPFYCWFTKSGQFFGFVSEWFSLIQKGNEGMVKRLYALQKKVEDSYYTDLAKTLTETPSSGLAVRDVTLFDPEKGSTATHQTVLVKGGRIERVGGTGVLSIPTGYKIIEGAGKFLMPGLWDMHCHFSKDQGPFMLAQGVTNIRDMGNGPELLDTRRQVDADSLLGPNISMISGLIDKAGPFAAPTGAIVDSFSQAMQAVQAYKDKGYDQIKIYSSVDPAWVKPMADKAHALGMRVCGHIPAYMTASQAVDAGYDEVTHINMLFLNFFGDTIDTRNMTRFFLVGRKGYSIDVKGDSVQAFIRKLQAHHTVLDPTVSAFEGMFIDLPGHMAKSYEPIAAYLPAQVRRSAISGSFLDKDSLIETYAASFMNMKRMVKELYDAGLVVLAGTDGGILQHELEIYSDAGVPNAAVLKMATYWPAQVAGKEKEAGTIGEGKVANMILVDGNPLEHMQDIRKVFVTIKDGKLYWPGKIYRSYGWGYYY